MKLYCNYLVLDGGSKLTIEQPLSMEPFLKLGDPSVHPHRLVLSLGYHLLLVHHPIAL
jgi:hypothetical protein